MKDASIRNGINIIRDLKIKNKERKSKKSTFHPIRLDLDSSFSTTSPYSLIDSRSERIAAIKYVFVPHRHKWRETKPIGQRKNILENIYEQLLKFQLIRYYS